MNISSIVKDAYKDGGYSKILSISFPEINYTVPTNDVYYESMALNEAIFDSDSFEVVGCIASMFEVQIRDTQVNLKGKKVVVTISLEDIDNSTIPLFTGYVDSVDKEAQKKMQKITAYDALYSKGQKDVASWYNNLHFPIAIGNFRDSLFNYIGITQEHGTLPNDSVVINKEFSPNTLKAIILIKAICQINGVFGIINRNDRFEYRKLDISVNAETVSFYRDIEYKDYIIHPVEKLILRQSTDDEGVTAGNPSGNNTYIVQGNFFTYNLPLTTLQTIANRIYTNVYSIAYTPFNASNNGYPWIECGLNCRLNYKVYDFVNSTESTDVYNSVYMSVMNRHMRGIQNLVDEYTAEGNELQREFISDISEDFTVLQQTVNNIAKHMSTEITTYRNTNQISISDGNTADVADMVYEAEQGNTIIFHEEIIIDAVASEVSSNNVYTEPDIMIAVRYYVNGYKLANHLSEGLIREGRNIVHLMQFWQAGEADINRVQAKLTVTGGAVTVQKFRANAYITVKQSDYIDANIEITRMPDKLVYELGDRLDFTGLIVSKVYFDDVTPSENITSRCTFRPAEWSEVTSTDDIEVLVTYVETNEVGEQKTYTTTMLLSTQYIVGISVEQEPTKDEYWIGESLDLTGIRVIADYVDGTTKDVTADCVYSPVDGYTFVSADEGEIYITYTERGITVDTMTAVAVKEVLIEEIKVTTPPNKMEYYAGEDLDLTGIVVTAFYNNGDTVDITSSCTFNPADGDVLTAENSVVEITYDEYMCVLETTVISPTGLEVTTPPTKVNYRPGENIDLTGVEISLVWEDGTKTDVTSECEFTPNSGDTVTSDYAGINVSYTFLDTEYVVLIEGVAIVLDSLEVTPPTNIDYLEGDILDYSGVVATARYSDGSSAVVTESCTFTPANGSTASVDASTVTVSYTEGDMTVEGDFELNIGIFEGIEVTHEPNKTEYLVGEPLRLEGTVVTATWSNGRHLDVTNDCTYSPGEGDILNADSSSVEVSYTYLGNTYTDTISITVETVELVDLQITTPPDITHYYSGETLDLEGMVVTAYFSNNATRDVTSQCVYTPSTSDALDTSITELEASYTYNGTTLTDSIPIYVRLVNLKYFYTIVDSSNHIIYITGLKQAEMEEDGLTTLKVPTFFDEGNVHWDIIIS